MSNLQHHNYYVWSATPGPHFVHCSVLNVNLISLHLRFWARPHCSIACYVDACALTAPLTSPSKCLHEHTLILLPCQLCVRP